MSVQTSRATILIRGSNSHLKKAVLITGIGGDIAQGVASILRESRPDLYLIGVDVHSQHGGGLFVDVVEVVPSATEIDYCNRLRAVIAKHGVKILIPMTEPELGVLYPFSDIFPGVHPVTAGAQVVAAGLDKLATIQAVKQLGLSVPWTLPVTEAPPPSFPCILKSRYGSGSRVVFRLENSRDSDYFSRKYTDAIYQELLEPADREVTCAVYRTRDGETMCLQMLRRLTGGLTGWAKTINDQETSNMCIKIAEGLDLRGSMNVQLRLTEQGPRVFEINPRFSSTVLMRHQIGFSDVLWSIQEAEGDQIKFPIINNHKIMVRTQSASVL
jgi:carbamoyl-phosphate synthase large subunit